MSCAIAHDIVCDGELVVLDEIGRPQWDRLKRRHVLRNPRRIRQAAEEEPGCIFAFDLLWLDGEDYRPRPLIEPKAALYDVPGQRGRVRPWRALRQLLSRAVAACRAA